jgi:pimeloyl-ACP methyl ester carboxylesterase
MRSAAMTDEPTDFWITVNGFRLHGLEWGSPGAPAMVLLHGIGDNAHIWEDLAASLRDRMRIIALDQRGHGQSDRAVPPAYRCENYVGDLAALMDTLASPRIVVGGHSMGALHATGYAAMNPERVSGLIHVDIEPCPPDWNRKYLLNLYRDLPHDYSSLQEYVDEIAKNCPHADPSHLMRYAALALNRDADGRFRRQYDREVLRSFEGYDLRPGLGNIDCPALLVRGEESQVMTRPVTEEMARSIPKAQIAEIPESAHPVMMENPAAFRQTVLDFLNQHRLA